MIALDPRGRTIMTRDMDLIRKILLAVQARKDVTPRPIVIDGVDEDILGRHVEMLLDAGMIEGVSGRSGSRHYKHILVKDLSWSGHDFVATLANDTVWNKLKETLSTEMTSLPLVIVKDAGMALLKEWVKQKIGL
jgi:hypothetical protein